MEGNGRKERRKVEFKLGLGLKVNSNWDLV